MRRPLFAATIVLVVTAWIRLAAGDYEGPPSVDAGSHYSEVYLTGRVCRKEDKKIWLESVIINQSIPYDYKIICELTDSGTELPLGRSVALSGTLAPFSRASNPGEFDAFVYYRSLGVGGRLRNPEVLGQSKEIWRVREALYQLKLCLKERLYRVYPEKDATVMSALLLGEKGETDQELKELYKRNGILHILSISSLHITIIGMSFYRLLRKMGLPVAPCAVAGGMVLVLYGTMTGFSVSACRAIGMYLIRMFGIVCGRTYDMLTSLGILAAVMTAANPCYLQNTGFLLSFSAVLGIGAVYPALVPREYPVRQKHYGECPVRLALGKFLRKLKYAALTSLSITLATLPVQLWFYYEVPVWSVVLNLFVLPLMKPMLITGFISMVPGFGAAGIVDRAILWWYEKLCGFFDKMPFGVWNPGRPALWKIVAYYCVLACVLALKRAREREDRGISRPGVWRIARSAAVLQGCLLAAAVLIVAVPQRPRNRVVFLDVGQGDCCLIQTKSGTNYLFDCGSSNRSSVGRYVLLPALKYYGIHTLDGVFLSHPDTDHMNGIMELLEFAGENHLAVRQLLLPAVSEGMREEEFGELLAVAEGMREEELGKLPVVLEGVWEEEFGEQPAVSEGVWEEGFGKLSAVSDGVWEEEFGEQPAVSEGVREEGFGEQPAVSEGVREEGFGEQPAVSDGVWEEEFGEQPAVSDGRVRVGWLAAGENWACGDVRFLCLHPWKDCSSMEGNAYSECVYADFGGFSLLLTGDVEGEGEQALLSELQGRDIRNITLLKVAHHGSRNSTSTEILAQLCPRVAVISCGQNNRYGHPHEELLGRLQEAGSYVFRTDRSGAITVEVDENIKIRGFLKSDRD